MKHRVNPDTSAHMLARARQLRKDSSRPERILWNIVRNRTLDGLKFRRQQPIGPYVADFFCEAARLVVELDGISHDDQEDYDVARDRYMRSLGLDVLRIQINDLLKDRSGVAEAILRLAQSRLPSPRPSPRGRGGD